MRSTDPDWARSRARFALPRAPGSGRPAVYLAGNSLGALPRAVAAALDRGVHSEWGTHGVAMWERGWWEAPERIGDRIGHRIGAPPGTTAVGDSTSVLLFGALVAAARLRPRRSVLLSDPDHFPTDRYLASSVARLCGLEVRTAPPAAMRPDGDTAVVSVPAVDFRTGRRHDLAGITARAHEAGAVIVADLSHAVGAMPVEIDAIAVDVAVGCTYKYLNAGPGAPAFVSVSRRHLDVWDPPLTGWTGHARPFAMEDAFVPATGAAGLRVGTPPILSMLAVDAALDATEDLPLDAVQHRSWELGDAFLAGLDPSVDVVTPRAHEERGAHVAVRVTDAQAACAALARRGVVVDARPPDLLRYGFAAPYVSLDDAAVAAEETNRLGRG